MTRADALSTVLARATDQLENGIRALVAGRVSDAEVWFRAARASLAILAAGKPARPLELVSAVRESTSDELEVWMERKHGEEK